LAIFNFEVKVDKWWFVAFGPLQHDLRMNFGKGKMNIFP